MIMKKYSVLKPGDTAQPPATDEIAGFKDDLIDVLEKIKLKRSINSFQETLVAEVEKN